MAVPRDAACNRQKVVYVIPQVGTKIRDLVIEPLGTFIVVPQNSACNTKTCCMSSLCSVFSLISLYVNRKLPGTCLFEHKVYYYFSCIYEYIYIYIYSSCRKHALRKPSYRQISRTMCYAPAIYLRIKLTFTAIILVLSKDQFDAFLNTKRLRR